MSSTTWQTDLDGGTNGGLELDNGLSVVGDLFVSFCQPATRTAAYLVVDNDLEVQSIVIHDLLDSLEVTPY
jgi:hypothetical protein